MGCCTSKMNRVTPGEPPPPTTTTVSSSPSPKPSSSDTAAADANPLVKTRTPSIMEALAALQTTTSSQGMAFLSDFNESPTATPTLTHTTMLMSMSKSSTASPPLISAAAPPSDPTAVETATLPPLKAMPTPEQAMNGKRQLQALAQLKEVVLVAVTESNMTSPALRQTLNSPKSKPTASSISAQPPSTTTPIQQSPLQQQTQTTQQPTSTKKSSNTAVIDGPSPLRSNLSNNNNPSYSPATPTPMLPTVRKGRHTVKASSTAMMMSMSGGGGGGTGDRGGGGSTLTGQQSMSGTVRGGMDDQDFDSKAMGVWDTCCGHEADSNKDFAFVKDHAVQLIRGLELSVTPEQEQQLVVQLIEMPGRLRADQIHITEWASFAVKLLKAEYRAYKAFGKEAADTALLFVVFCITSAEIVRTVSAACEKMEASGTTSMSEMRQILKSLEYGLSSSEITTIMRSVSPDSEGMIHTKEWAKGCFKSLAAPLVLKSRRLFVKEREIRNQLQRAIYRRDPGMTGSLTVKEAQSLLLSPETGFKVMPEEVATVIQVYKTQTGSSFKSLEEGGINYRDFLPIAVRQLQIVLADQPDSQFATFVSSKRLDPYAFQRSAIDKALNDALNQADVSHTGMLDHDVVRGLLKTALQPAKLEETDYDFLLASQQTQFVDIKSFVPTVFSTLHAMALGQAGPVPYLFDTRQQSIAGSSAAGSPFSPSSSTPFLSSPQIGSVDAMLLPSQQPPPTNIQ